MNVPQIAALTATLFNVILTFFVFGRNFRSTLHQVYLLWGLGVIFWNLSALFMFGPISPESAYLWAKLLQIGVIIMPISLFHLCVLMAQTPVGQLLPILYLVHMGFLVSLFSGSFIIGVRKIEVGYWSIPGPAFWIFICFYMVMTTALVLFLYQKQRVVPPIQRTRLRLMLWAIVGLWVFGTNDLMPILGFDTYPLTRIRLYPLGNLAAIFYVVLVGYSVLQHQLLDVRITLGKIAAHLVRLLFVFLIGMAILLLLTILVPDQFTPFAFAGSLGVLLITAIIASNYFPRLFGTGSDALERLILGDRFEYHDKIQGFIQSIPWYSDTNQLLVDFHDLLVRTVEVRNYRMILLDEGTRSFVLFRSHPEHSIIPWPELHSDSPVFELFRREKMDYLGLNPNYAARGELSRERAAREQLQLFEASICFRFSLGEDPIGLLLVGEKANGEPYTPYDLHLFSLMVKNLSLILNQIRLKNQVLLAEEMELMGRMSRGIAHDLNNLLTPVSTFLQLFMDGEPSRDKTEELLPTALRNVKTIQSYIKEALFFSKHHTPQLRVSRLDLLVHKAVELVEDKLKQKNVDVSLQTSPEAVAELDEVMMQRLISNLLNNAIDASPPGSRIQIELQKLARTEISREWLRLKIIDQGEGISRENLKRIFAPYFTTKDRGDQARGFGLGLAISRKIVHLHGGNLNVSSVEKKGTTVQVDLPSRQLNRAMLPAMNHS